MGIENLNIQGAMALAGQVAGNSSSGKSTGLSRIVAQTEGEKQRARDDRQIQMLVNQKTQEYSFDLTMLTGGIATNDFWGMGKAIDTFLTETEPAFKRTLLEQRSAIFVNAQPAIKNMRQTLRKLMESPIVKIQPRDANGDFLTLQNGTLTTEIADRYKTPMTMPQLISAAESDMYAARQILFNVGPSQKEARAKELGLIWSKGNDEEFGNRPRLLDHDESKAFKEREIMVENIMKKEQVSRDHALDTYRNNVNSTTKMNLRIEDTMKENGVGRVGAMGIIADEDQESRRLARHTNAVRNMNTMLNLLPEPLRANKATRNAAFASALGADSPAGHALALFDNLEKTVEAETLKGQLVANEKELAELQMSRTEATSSLIDFPTEAATTTHDLMDQARVTELQIPGMPDAEKRGAMLSVRRLRQLGTLNAGASPDGKQAEFIEKHKVLKKINDKTTPRGFGIVVRGLTRIDNKTPDQLLSDLKLGESEFKSLVDTKQVAWSQTGSIGEKERWFAALMTPINYIIDNHDGTVEAAEAAKIKSRLYAMDGVGVKFSGTNRSESLEKAQARDKREKELNLENRDLRNRGATTALDLQRTTSETQAQTNFRTKQLEVGGRVIKDNPRLGLELMLRSETPLSDEVIASTLTQPTNVPEAGGKQKFTDNNELQSAVNDGRVKSGETVSIGGVDRVVNFKGS